MLTHRNIVANMLQARAWMRPILDRQPARGDHHAAAALSHLLADGELPGVHALGGENVLITNPRDIPGFVKEMRQATGSPRSPASTRCSTRCSTTRSSRKLDFSALQLTLGGGMAVQEAVAERWKQVTGCTLIEAYGLTETSPAATINPLDLRRVQRLDRPADPVDRRRAARRRGQRRAARPAGRDLHPRPAGDGGLLAAAGRDRQGHRRRTAGFTPATSASMDERASSRSSIARRT